MQKHSTDAYVTDFMSEFARYLVAAGITSARFSAITRQAYFRAASQSARFSNSRINQSAVAAMTGLTRVQVRAFAKSDVARKLPKSDRLDKIVRGWNSDPAFSNPNSIPRRLKTGGKNSPFGRLVRKYGGDVPTRSILREMLRVDLVDVRGNFVHLKRTAYETTGQAQLRNVAQHLARMISGPSAARGRAYPLSAIFREITFSNTSSKGRALLQRKAEEGLQAFVAELKAAGDAASNESPVRMGVKPRIARSRVLILTDEADAEGSESTIK